MSDGGREAVSSEGSDDRERDFWGHHVQDLASCLAEVAAGPDPNTEAMLRAVEPVAGSRILDFACGTGATSMWLAQRGAMVVGVDLSPVALARAREVQTTLGLDGTFVTSLEAADSFRPFDAVVGRYALHHIDVTALAPLLAERIRPAGRGAFVETFATNPLLKAARRKLPGRYGIPKYGTADEHPLLANDVEALRRAFGSLEIQCDQMHFLRILDRQILRYRSSILSRILNRIDDLANHIPGSTRFSYFQVVVLRKTLP
jgi:SAM-dependent methyltransferase